MTKQEVIAWLIEELEGLGTSFWQQQPYKDIFWKIFKAQYSARVNLCGDEVYMKIKDQLDPKQFAKIEETTNELSKAWAEWEFAANNLAQNDPKAQ